MPLNVVWGGFGPARSLSALAKRARYNTLLWRLRARRGPRHGGRRAEARVEAWGGHQRRGQRPGEQRVARRRRLHAPPAALPRAAAAAALRRPRLGALLGEAGTYGVEEVGARLKGSRAYSRGPRAVRPGAGAEAGAQEAAGALRPV